MPNDPILCCDQWFLHDQQWLTNGHFSEGFEMFFFSHGHGVFVLFYQRGISSSVTVPATSFIDDLGPLRSLQATFVWKIGFDEACVNDLEIDGRVEIVYAGFQTFRDLVTVKT